MRSRPCFPFSHLRWVLVLPHLPSQASTAADFRLASVPSHLQTLSQTALRLTFLLVVSARRQEEAHASRPGGQVSPQPGSRVSGFLCNRKALFSTKLVFSLLLEGKIAICTLSFLSFPHAPNPPPSPLPPFTEIHPTFQMLTSILPPTQEGFLDHPTQRSPFFQNAIPRRTKFNTGLTLLVKILPLCLNFI